MKLIRSVTLSLSLASMSALVVACGGTVEHSPQTSASAATKAPLGTNTRGVVKIVSDALGEVPLRSDQRTEIETLAAEAEARHAPTADARKELMLTFADQVENGAIDRAALQAKIDAAAADLEKVRADDRAALVKLHALLDAEQRHAFVDALEEQMKSMKSKRGDRGAHAKGGFGKMKQLAADLELTDEQKSQIKDAMREARKEGKETWKRRRHERAGHGAAHADRKGPRRGPMKVLEAFREDKLDLDKLALRGGAEPAARSATLRMASMAEKVLPILTPQQRKIAADKLRAMAASGDASLLGHGRIVDR